MYLSSRLAACVGLAALFAAEPAGAELAARAAFGGVRPTIVSRPSHFPYSGIAPTIVSPRHPGYGGERGIAPTIVSRGRRGARYGYGGYGGGLGYDGAFTSDLGAAGYPAPEPGPFDAPSPFAFRPRPAPCPQIIEIRGGLAHKVRTQVVSGAPCRR